MIFVNSALDSQDDFAVLALEQIALNLFFFNGLN
jgi:hypothetical protein